MFWQGFNDPSKALLITGSVLYRCYLIFKISSKAGILFYPVLFVMPAFIFEGKKAS